MRKINPNDLGNSSDLTTLNSYIKELTDLLKQQLQEQSQKAIQDAIKAVNCLRFIKVNYEFIKYAFNNKSDMSVYTYGSADKSKGVLRDFDNTAFHLNSYHTFDACWKDLTYMIEAFENAIAIVKRRNKQMEFLNKIRYENDIGCLDARIRPSLEYVSTLEATKLENIDDIFQELFKDFTADEQHDYKLAFRTLKEKKLIGQDVIIESEDKTLTYPLIVEYMQNTLGYAEPEKHWYDPPLCQDSCRLS